MKPFKKEIEERFQIAKEKKKGSKMTLSLDSLVMEIKKQQQHGGVFNEQDFKSSKLEQSN